jgi:type I restriction enzyme, S subunit
LKTRSYRLGEICTFIKGTYSIMKTEPGDYPLVVTASFRRTANSYQIEGQAICIPLISSTGHGDAALHRIHYQEGRFALGTLLVALLPKVPVAYFPTYLYYLLNAKKDALLVPLMQGTANVSLKVDDIAGVEVRLPPISEQRRIAALLGAAADRIASAQAERRASTALLPVLFRRVYDLTCNGGETAGALRMGLSECCEALIDYRGRTPPVSEAGIPHITSRNIRDGRISWTNTRYVSEATYSAYMTRGIPKAGDVLFTMEAPLGEAAVVPEGVRFSIAQRTLLLRPRSELMSGEYLKVILMSPQVRASIVASATGTTVKGIAAKRLRKISVPVPPLPDQHRIVAYLADLQAQVNVLRALQEKTAAELGALMPSILDKAFRGEL